MAFIEPMHSNKLNITYLFETDNRHPLPGPPYSVLPKLFIAPVRMPFRTSNTHNSYMITEFFTRPKHDFTRLGRVDGWLGRTLSY